jgi:acyl-homoserine lactone acylase PvdQ
MDLRGNTSNNTVFADSKGNIAYWHGNYVPKRNNKYDWAKPVDGSLSATDWQGVHTVNETVHIINPANGWIQNCNSTPFTVAGSNSPKRENYPAYMAPDGENFRGINAVNVLSREPKFTLDKIIAAGYDTKLTAFEILVPALLKAFDNHVTKTDSLYNQLAELVSLLRAWDYYSADNSIATTLAIEWAQKLSSAIQQVYIEVGETDQPAKTRQFAQTAKPDQLLIPLLAVKFELISKFGKWDMPWGEINRYQRLTGFIAEKYDDNQPSLAVGSASAVWGCLPSFVSRYMPGTLKRYGVSGNSFVCAVEFVRKDSVGDRKVKARSVLSGGVCGDPGSKHFRDQAEMYTKGQFKEVLFYKEDVLKNMERTYRPGE